MVENTDNSSSIAEALQRYRELLWEQLDNGVTKDEAIEAALEQMSSNEDFQVIMNDDPDNAIGSIEAELPDYGDGELADNALGE